MEKLCKNCNKKLSGRWKNFCSRKCGGFFYIKNNAKETGIERKIREWLEREKIPFQSQVAIKNITLADFVLRDKLVVYSDGSYWHSLPKRKYYDSRINRRLEKLGYKVLRFDEKVINDEFDTVINVITNELSKNTDSPIVTDLLLSRATD